MKYIVPVLGLISAMLILASGYVYMYDHQAMSISDFLCWVAILGGLVIAQFACARNACHPNPMPWFSDTRLWLYSLIVIGLGAKLAEFLSRLLYYQTFWIYPDQNFAFLSVPSFLGCSWLVGSLMLSKRCGGTMKLLRKLAIFYLILFLGSLVVIYISDRIAFANIPNKR